MKKDIVVIGAGIMGCAIGYEFAKKGYAVLVVDALGEPGAGSTSNSCAIIRFSYSTHEGVALSWESRAYWADWGNYVGAADEKGLIKFINKGSLELTYPSYSHQALQDRYDRAGITWEYWDKEKLEQKVPFFNLKKFYPPRRPEDDLFFQEPDAYIQGGMYTPQTGYINDPVLSCHNLMRGAEAKGAQFLFQARVVDILKEDDRVTGVVLEDGRKILSDIVVNATGPHSGVINKMAGVCDDMNIRTRPLRHEVHYVPSSQGVDFEAFGMHIGDGDSGAYYRPESGNLILVGSEDPDCDPKEWVDDPDDFNRSVTQAQWHAQAMRLARRVKGLAVPNEPKGVVDLYDVSDDWIPIYDKSSLKGFYMAVGTSGNQYKNGPAVGQLMVDLIEYCEHGEDHDACPIIFKCRYTGLEINAGAFSRKREINPNSTFSVNG